MVRFKIVDNRLAVSKKIKELQERLGRLPKEYLKEFANEVVLNSPVDTGTYMDAHNVGVEGPVVSSHGKPRNQPYEPHANDALARLYAQIDALPDEQTKYYISNNSVHAFRVEYEYGYAPYTTARARAQELLDKVIRETGL